MIQKSEMMLVFVQFVCLQMIKNKFDSYKQTSDQSSHTLYYTNIVVFSMCLWTLSKYSGISCHVSEVEQLWHKGNLVIGR